MVPNANGINAILYKLVPSRINYGRNLRIRIGISISKCSLSINIISIGLQYHPYWKYRTDIGRYHRANIVPGT